MRPWSVALSAAVLLLALPASGATTISQSMLTDAAGAAGDNFGAAVAASDDRVVVGAPAKNNNTGSIFIYQRLEAGGWTGIRVQASDGQPGDQFGYSVAIDGDRVVAGALFGDGAGPDSGTAYIFEPNDDGTWRETEIPATDGAELDRYGVSVAISGDRVVVGANWDDDLGPESGSVYVHEWDGTAWHYTKLTASDGATNDLFGRSVAIDGGLMAVGAIYADGGAVDQGAVYLFEDADDGWGGETVVRASDGGRWELFGDSVAVSGDRVVVGAPLAENGTAYIFDRSGSGWHETQLEATDGTLDDQFGNSVAVSADRIAIGAPLDGATAQNAGAVYTYVLADGHWFETKLTDEAGTAGDTYGAAVGMDGDLVAIGVPLFDGAGRDSGRVYAAEPAETTDVESTPDPVPPADTEPEPESETGSEVSIEFDDTATSIFAGDIRWMAKEGITEGCGNGDFCPNESVTRAQMAVFLTRALGLEVGSINPFTDVGGPYAGSAAAIAAAGISLGCGDGSTFCPHDPVTRAQMGSFFARALDLDLRSENRFADVRGTHAAAINAIAAEGITLGCNPEGTRFCPHAHITRGQMAAFLHRALGE